jgi:hypothetical protein
MDLVRPNAQGFLAFPTYFKPGEGGSGDELDGTAAICIALVLLWQRLPAPHAMRDAIERFLNSAGSPLRFIHGKLQESQLLSGSGEFGGGCGVEGVHVNVVQNTLVRYALSAAAGFEAEIGDLESSESYAKDAQILERHILGHLVGADGGWIWCIDPHTLQPDPAVIDHIINRGFGGLNAPACMFADVFGMEPRESGWPGVQPSLATFDRLYSHPMRKRQFESYGIWTQFDDYMGGYYSGPSYGHGYALQTMLLYDMPAMAEKALHYLVEATWRPPRQFPMHRESQYWFYERYCSPEDPGGPAWDEGCGALNLVCVAEPLKIARLIAGIDDTRADAVHLVPRLPSTWEGFHALDWPLRTSHGTIRADIHCSKRGASTVIAVDAKAGGSIPRLRIRTGVPPRARRHELHDVASVEVAFRTEGERASSP